MRYPATIRSAAWAGGGDGLEKTDLELAFVPLTDSAPLVIAKERGFFRRHGLNVRLVREPSWANVRDKLAAGVVDGAQMLAPMPLASTLGLGGVVVPTVTALSLDLNGNAITVSSLLYQRMLELDPEGMLDGPATARALRRVIDASERPLTFGVVFPFSTHNYELRYWLASAGIRPERDLRIRVVPPPSMVDLLRDGRLDGYCVGEPWNRYAEQQGVGRTLVSGYEIWQNAPEKVFAVSREWAERHPNTHLALVAALLEATAWLDDFANRTEACHVIAGESFVDAPVEVVRASLLGDVGRDAAGGPGIRDFHVFQRYAANFPWCSHAAWFLSQMLRWGQIEKPLAIRRLVEDVYRPDVFRRAAARVGVDYPTVDAKTEGGHARRWTLTEASRPIAMGPDAFCDGRRFDPNDVVGYIEGFEITELRVRLDELAFANS